MAVHGTEGGIEPGVHGVGSLIQHAATMVGDGLELELEAVGGAGSQRLWAVLSPKTKAS